MKTSTLHYLAGALALLTFLAISNASYASCTGSNRISENSAACLTASLVNDCKRRIFGRCVDWDSRTVMMLDCELSGDEKTVFKIDLAGGRDRNFTFTASEHDRYDVQSHSSGHRARDVCCCNDLGKCN